MSERELKDADTLAQKLATGLDKSGNPVKAGKLLDELHMSPPWPTACGDRSQDWRMSIGR